MNKQTTQCKDKIKRRTKWWTDEHKNINDRLTNEYKGEAKRK